MEHGERRAGLDPNAGSEGEEKRRQGGSDRSSAGEALDREVLGTPWWDGGPGPEETVEEKPEAGKAAPAAPGVPLGTGYVYRGVRYGTPVPQPAPEPKPQAPVQVDDPADTGVAGVQPANPAAAPPAARETPPERNFPPEKGSPAEGSFAAASWWESNPTPVGGGEAGGAVRQEFEPRDAVHQTPEAKTDAGKTAPGAPEVPPEAGYVREEGARGEEPVAETYAAETNAAETSPRVTEGAVDRPATVATAAPSEETPAVPGPQEETPAPPPPQGETEGPAGAPWWRRRALPEESSEAGTAPQEPGPGAPLLYRGTGDASPVPQPASHEPRNVREPADLSVPAAPPEEPPASPISQVAAGDPAASASWWRGHSWPENLAEEPPAAEDTTDDLAPGAPLVPAAAPPSREETRPFAGSSPWWRRHSRLEDPAAEASDGEEATDEPAPGPPRLYRGTGYLAPVPDPPSRELEIDDEPGDPSLPAAPPDEPRALAPAEGTEERPAEDPSGDPEETIREPAPPADMPAEAAALPDGPPGELIQSIVAEVCPGELLLVDTAQASLPEWAGAAVTAATNDLDRRQAEGESIDSREYLRLAIVENVLGLHVEAEHHLKEALPRSDRFGPVLNALAVMSLARGKLGPAIVYGREALRETGGDDSIRAAASSNLGDFCRLQGDAAQAVEAYETAIECLGPEGDARWLSRLHLRAGRLYRRLEDRDKARLHLSDSVRLFEDSGDDVEHVRALAELGSALNELRLHDVAIRNFEGAIRICLRTGDKHGAALVQGEMGVAYMCQDQFTRALTYFDSALSLYRELGDREGEAATLSNMGKIHDSRGDVDEAQKFHQAALEIHRDLGHEAGDEEGAAARQPRQEEDGEA